MRIKDRFEDLGVVVQLWESTAKLRNPAIKKQTWLRACHFINLFGIEQALDIIDQRAERAADRKDWQTAARWRTLITAIHALEDDERFPAESSH